MARIDDVIIPIDDFSDSNCKYSDEERQARCNLASLYRLVDMKNWSEGVFNHISVRISERSEREPF